MAFWIKSTGGEEKEKSLLVVAANAHLKQLEINMVGEGAGGKGPTINRKWAGAAAGRTEGAASGGAGNGGAGNGGAGVGGTGVGGTGVGGADVGGAADSGGAADVGGWQPSDQNLSRLVQAAAQQEGQLYHLIL